MDQTSTIRQTSVTRRVSQKLSKRYFGPFKVEQRIGLVAYKVALPSSSKIHPVFHVSQLRAFHDRTVLQPSNEIPPDFEPLDPSSTTTSEELCDS